MKILLVGASGTIGRAVAAALSPRHDIIEASRSGANHADITDVASLEALFAKLGKLDAVISAAGGARYRALAELTEEDFAFSLGYKLMGQINLARLAVPHLSDNGSITLSGGLWGREPVANTTAIATVNAALEGFGRAAALELPRGIRLNVVVPPLVGTPEWQGDKPMRMTAEDTALAYVESVEGTGTGRIIDTGPFARR